MSNRNTRGVAEWANKSYNIYLGCSNNCNRYCYACASEVKRLKRKTYDNWHEMVLNEKNLNKNWARCKPVREISYMQEKEGTLTRGTKPVRKRIMFPTRHDITDNTLVVDNCLTVIKKMLTAGHAVLVTTKPNMTFMREAVRELQPWMLTTVDVYNPNTEEYQETQQLQFRFTITHVSLYTGEYWEPSAPTYSERRIALSLAYDKGYATSLSIEPFLESPSSLMWMIKELQEMITESIWVGPMNPRHLRFKDDWQEHLWGREALVELKDYIDRNPLINHKLIRYKDAFLNVIK